LPGERGTGKGISSGVERGGGLIVGVCRGGRCLRICRRDGLLDARLVHRLSGNEGCEQARPERSGDKRRELTSKKGGKRSERGAHLT